MSLVRRSDLVAQQLATPPWGARRFAADDPPVRVGATGTGADLLLLGWTASELAREVDAGVALLRRFGVAPGPPPPGFTGWQRTWLAVAEASSFVAGSCERGGFHAAGDAAVRDGELVLDSGRYASGLRARAIDACPCGAGAAFAL